MTANLAVLLAASGRRVGVIDTDIQSPGIHVIFARKPDDVSFSLNDYLGGRCRIEQAAYDVTDAAIGAAPGKGARLFLIPASIETGAIAKILREGYDVGLLNEGFHRLVVALELDYLLIDTHPGVNEETLLSIAVSDLFLLVLRPDSQDFQGTSVTVELARRLDVAEILVVLNKTPASMDPGVLAMQVEQAYAASVIGVLPLCEEIAELGSAGLFVNRFPQHPVSEQLRQLAQRIA